MRVLETVGSSAPKIRAHLSKLSSFAIAQMAVQLISVVTGILVVRMLAPHEFGFYALAVTVQTALNVISEAGLSGAMLRMGADGGHQPEYLSILRASCLRTRRRLSGVLGLPAAGYLAWVLSHNGASTLLASMLTLLIFVNLQLSLTASMERTMLEMLLQFKRVQVTLIGSSVLRLGLTGLTVFIYPSPETFLLGTALAAFAELRLYRRSLVKSISLKADADDASVAKFRWAARRVLPLNVFIVLQGQATPFILATLGQIGAVASLSAVSRFPIVFSILTSTLAGLVAPLFSRVTGAGRVRRGYVGIVAAYFAAISVIWLLLAACSAPLLALLGKNYSHLRFEFLVLGAGSAMFNFASAVNYLNQSRGWIRYSWVYIPISVTWTAFLAFVLNFHDLHQAAIFSALAFVPGLISNLGRGIIGMRRDAKIARAPVQSSAQPQI